MHDELLCNHRRVGSARVPLAHWEVEVGEERRGSSSPPGSLVETGIRRKSALQAIGGWCYQKLGWPGHAKENESISSIF